MKLRMVDIGTEWNLKTDNMQVKTQVLQVDIGTEWNLKQEFDANIAESGWLI